MVKSIKKILIVMIIIIMINLNVFAKYNITYYNKIMSLNRDGSEIIYSIKKSEEDFTNKNVILEIDVNKEIEKVDDFEISEDGKKLTKEFFQNATGSILVSDKYGNSKNINYEISNIDKIPPVIEGVEDGVTYNSNLNLNYKDNVGIKEIKIKKYGKLEVRCYSNYYDTSVYKGIDVNCNSISLKIKAYPINTEKFNYYIDNKLIKTTNDKIYTFKNLKPSTTYNIKVEAIDEKNNVLETYTNTITTKMFESITSEKKDNVFKAKLINVDSRVVRAISTEYRESDRNNITYTTLPVNKDRSMDASLVLSHVSDKVINENYYMQIHFKDGSDNTLQKLTFIVRWNESYVENDLSENPYSITENGNYEIIVVDLAGNEVKKYFTLKK